MTTIAKPFALVALVATMSVGALALSIASASAQSPAAYKNYCITRIKCNNGFLWKCNRCDAAIHGGRGAVPPLRRADTDVVRRMGRAKRNPSNLILATASS